MKKIYILAVFAAFYLASCSKKGMEPMAEVENKVSEVSDALAWRSKAPGAGPARKIQIGDYNAFDLANGLKVIVVENHKIPRVSYQLSLNHDALVEGDQAGYTSIAGQLMKAGTKTKSKSEIDQAIDFIGASLNTSANGMFGSSLTKHQDKLLDVMTDVLYNASFPEDEFEKIKKQTFSGLASNKTDPSAMSQNVSLILRNGKGHPYGEVQTEETVNAIELAKCKEYYEQYFVANNAYLIIVGDITPEQAKMTAEKHFGAWKSGNVMNKKYDTPVAPDETKVSFVNKDGAVQSVINVTYPVDLTTGDDDQIAASLMNSILGGGIFSGRLMQNLREDKAYTYGARSSLRADKLIGSFSAGASVRNEVTDSSVHEFMYELNRLVNEDVAVDDLQLAKNSSAGQFARSLESPQTIARFARNTFKYNLPKDYYNTYLEKLEAVSVADIRAAAQKYIKPNNAHIVVVGSKDDVAEKLIPYDADGVIDYYDAFGNVIKEEAAMPEGITAETVISDYIEAIGGEKKLMSVKSMHQVMSMEVMGQEASMDISQEAPNKFALKVGMQGMIMQEQIFDGTKLKAGGMGQSKVMTEGAEVEKMKEDAVMFPELYYKAKGYKMELKGIESVDGEKCYKMSVESPGGSKSTEFYSVSTSLVVRKVSSQDGPQGPVTVTNDYKDYKAVDGIMIPHTMSVSGVMPVPLVSSMKSIEINKPIPAGTFTVE